MDDSESTSSGLLETAREGELGEAADVTKIEIGSSSDTSEAKLDLFSITDVMTEADKLDLFSASSVAGFEESYGPGGDARQSMTLDDSVSSTLVSPANPSSSDASDQVTSPKILDEDWGAAPAHSVVYPTRNYVIARDMPSRSDAWGNEIKVVQRQPLGEDWRTRNAMIIQSNSTFPNNIPLGKRRSANIALERGPRTLDSRRTDGNGKKGRTASFPAPVAPRAHLRPSSHLPRGPRYGPPRLEWKPSRSSNQWIPPLTPRERHGPPHMYISPQTKRRDERSRISRMTRFEIENLTRIKSRRRAEQQRRLAQKDSQPERERPFRFAPDTFSMGSVGKDDEFQPGFCFPVVESSIAWDPVKRAFLLDIIPVPMQDEAIPLALEMIDARIQLEDIATRGIKLAWSPVKGTPVSREGLPYQGSVRDVTLTMMLRRPPQFFVPLTDEFGKFSHRSIKVVPAPDGGQIPAQEETPAAKGSVRELNLPSLRAVEPYLAEYRAAKTVAGLDNTGRTRKISGGVFLGPREAIMAKDVREVVKQLRMLPRKVKDAGPIGYDKIQPDGLSGRVRRRPIETAVMRWRRATEFDFSISKTGCEREAGAICVDNDIKFKVNFWQTYRFTFYMNERGFESLERLLRQLRLIEKEEDAEFLDNLIKEEPAVAIDPEYPVRPVQQPTLDPVKLLTIEVFNKLRFSTKYLIEGLVSQAIIQSHQVEELVDELAKVAGDHADLINDVLESLFILENIPDVTKVLKKRFAWAHRALSARKTWRPEEKAHTHHARVRKVVVTPTRILVAPPEQENSNSILRMYSQYENRFLRVQFNDEHDRLAINPQVLDADRINPSTGTIARVRRTLSSGLVIAGRKYVFLAASSSQAKETSAWFFCNVSKKDNGGVAPFTVKDIMDSIGTIKEQIIAKHAARQGLVFSGSVPADIAVKKRNKPLPDIKGTENGEMYTFTDGVGKCSQSICDASAKALGLKTDVDLHPSAVQFRLGGSKGLLVAWPDVKPREVWLRPSQIKFDSDLKDLHVVRVSQYRNAFLNRQYVILLCDLGVPREVFLTKFMQQAERVLNLPGRVRAGTISAEDLNLVDKISAFPIRPLIMAGYAADPVVQDVLSVVERRLLAELRWHARIEIEEGVYLYGVADESDTLAEGEVFCQYNNPEDIARGNIVALGKCTVCRAPALHPGDIRLVTAVDKPALHHLVNVIVFSIKGDRDLPNKLGGGDLDGDEFALIWDNRIVDHVKEVAPAEYKAPNPQAVQWVEPEDIKQNYVNHLLNDILGVCGNAHLAFADMEGPSSIKCRKICEIYSTAVDFAKTGIPAFLPSELKPSRYPDFMGKPPHMSYPGKSVLGDLYRQAATLEATLPPHFHPTTRADIGPGDMDPRIACVQVPMKILQLAVRLKNRYDMTISYLLMRYKLTEMEVLSGLALRNARRKRIRDNDLKEPLRDAYKDLVNSTRELAEHAMAGMHLPETGNSHLRLFAAAAYQVTFDRQYDSLFDDIKGKGVERDAAKDVNASGDEGEDEEPKLISFAWVLWKELLSLSGQMA